MYCVIKCVVRGNQARVKNADLRHPSCTVVTQRRKSASPVRNVLKIREDTFYVVAFTKLSNRTDDAQARVYLFWSCLRALHCICTFGTDF